MVLRPSHNEECLEGWPMPVFDMLQARLNNHDLFSPEYDALATSLFGEAYPLETDREGRIVMPAALTELAHITDGVMFLGRGLTFQIWEPQAGRQYVQDCRKRARTEGLTLSALGLALGGAGANGGGNGGQNIIPTPSPGTPTS